MRLLLPLLIINISSAFAADIDCIHSIATPINNSTFIINAKDFIRAKYESSSSSCKELDIGDITYFNTSDAQSPTGLARKYGLKRIDEKRFEVILNLQFKSVRDNAGDVENMWKHVNDCLSLANRAFLGPNGESFTIRQANSDEAANIQASKVNVRPPSNARDDNLTYATDIECSSMMHEFMHILGLVDEYPERFSGFSKNPSTGKWEHVEEDAQIKEYDCRAGGPYDSFLHKHRAAWKKVFVTKEKKSLLMPRHFRVITRQDCEENSDYYQCAKNAMLSSHKLTSTGELLQTACPLDTPLSCRNGSGSWLETK